MSEHQWVTITTVQGELQAELMRGLLEAQGVPVQLIQEGLGRVYGLGVGPLAEVEILVSEEYQSEALEIIRAYHAGEFDQPDPPTGT
ncbi:MAG: DUF2007 domain-containing protein [Anaerolineales bacterium]|nr:DUF2007 domain-containing protein [Anaerolineales bacterium]